METEMAAAMAAETEEATLIWFDVQTDWKGSEGENRSKQQQNQTLHACTHMCDTIGQHGNSSMLELVQDISYALQLGWMWGEETLQNSMMCKLAL